MCLIDALIGYDWLARSELPILLTFDMYRGLLPVQGPREMERLVDLNKDQTFDQIGVNAPGPPPLLHVHPPPITS